MTTSTKPSRRLTGMLMLVGATLAIAAPTAVAGHDDLGTTTAAGMIQGVPPSDGTRTLPVARAQSAREIPDAFERYLRSNPGPFRPADRAGTRGIGEQRSVGDTSDVVSRYLDRNRVQGRTAVGGTDPALRASAPPRVTFHWRDAGIGAGTALAVMLIAFASMIILLRHKPFAGRMLPR